MQEMGLKLNRIRAGYTNMFLSTLFSETFANLIDCPLELYNTDGAVGAARGAGFGAKYYLQFADCFRGMEAIRQVNPEKNKTARIREVYNHWKEGLEIILASTQYTT